MEGITMKKGMSTAGWVLIAIGIVAVLAVMWGVGTYNYLVGLDQAVGNGWSNVQVDYQRRFDLVPNLVETVKGYATHEAELLTNITLLRSRWQGAATQSDQMAAAQQLEGALGRLIAVSENYPDLKASENFKMLQDQLEGTENRISVSRTRFNAAIKEYNTAIKRFPTMFIANWAGFTEKQYFESAAGAETVPQVKF
jgi:LemA protein